MATTFYFYDLETSGFNPRQARIMQFGGQRTTLDLKPLGDPHNILIRMTPDVVPDPDAVLVTGITPQKTIADGVSEAEFLQVFHKEIATDDTVFVGYNSVRFDDEFMRFLHYRNFHDAYEWQYKNGRSRWDLLDVVRMTRALRPDGVEWPFDSEGRPSNRLELLTAVNKLEHADAHDALADVVATVAVARLIRKAQPKLFDYLLNMRDKKLVRDLTASGQPFVYTSGKYPSEWEKTTVVATLFEGERQDSAVVFDLRNDPKPFLGLSVEELSAAWRRRYNEEGLHLPVKTLKYNRCPAVAPLSVLDDASKKRLQIDDSQLQKHLAVLHDSTLIDKLKHAQEQLDKLQQTTLTYQDKDVDAALYDGFVQPIDRDSMARVRAADGSTVKELTPKFRDDRLAELFPLYRARNFSGSLNPEQAQAWEAYRRKRLLEGKPNRLETYFERLGQLAETPYLNSEHKYLIEELQLYGQSVLPDDGHY